MYYIHIRDTSTLITMMMKYDDEISDVASFISFYLRLCNRKGRKVKKHIIVRTVVKFSLV